MCAPTTFGVKLTVQLVETAPVIGSVVAPPSVQLLGVKLPPLSFQPTVPVGAVAAVSVASVTFAVQLVGEPTGTVAGEQETEVVVACCAAVTMKVPELMSCVLSPP